MLRLIICHRRSSTPGPLTGRLAVAFNIFYRVIIRQVQAAPFSLRVFLSLRHEQLILRFIFIRVRGSRSRDETSSEIADDVSLVQSRLVIGFLLSFRFCFYKKSVKEIDVHNHLLVPTHFQAIGLAGFRLSSVADRTSWRNLICLRDDRPLECIRT